MNAVEMKNTARNATVALLTDTFSAVDAVQYADNAWAILQEVDGQEIWTSIEVKTKQYKDTSKTPAFDPFEAAKEWEAEKKVKEEEKAAKAAERERKKAEKEKKKKED